MADHRLATAYSNSPDTSVATAATISHGLRVAARAANVSVKLTKTSGAHG